MMGKILLVDDEPLIVRILSVALKSKGHDVATAASGLQALDVARKYNPHLVISDVTMPGMNGFELVQAIRAEFPGTECILMSGGTDFDDVRVRRRTEALKLAATFKKPFSVAAFFAVVDRTLKGSAAPA